MIHVKKEIQGGEGKEELFGTGKYETKLRIFMASQAASTNLGTISYWTKVSVMGVPTFLFSFCDGEVFLL